MDKALKQRLVGAAVLVALAVIFLPMLIKAPAPASRIIDAPTDTPAASGSTPPPATAAPAVRELPLLSAPGDIPAGGVMGMDTTPPEATAPAAPPPAATPPARRLPAESAHGAYAVHFGSYASRTDAAKVTQALADVGIRARIVPVTLGQAPAFAVRMGPYASRADAQAIRSEAAKLGGGSQMRIVALDAEPAANAPQPATAATPPETARPPAPAAAAGSFAVQLGAFSRSAEADALRERVRAAGFPAMTETVATDKGTLTRVRVGPVASRAAAEQLKAQVQARLQISGDVRSHP